MPMKSPPHPGDFIRTEIIDLAGLSVTAAAKALQVSRPALSSLLKRQREPFRRYGAAHRKGFRRENGHADADAVVLRHSADPKARKGDPGPTCPPSYRDSRMVTAKAKLVESLSRYIMKSVP
jgi:hypothetical protein